MTRKYQCDTDKFLRHRDTFSRSRAAVHNIDYSGGSMKEFTSKASANVFRLPAEITVKIFKSTQLVSGYENLEWCWITITHVCRRWREIALDNQELWTHIDTHLHASPEQTLAYLERSGTSPLTVHFHTYGRSQTTIAVECLHLALAHLPRVRELHIHASPSGVRIPDETLSALSHYPAPELQKFILELSSSNVFDVSLRTLFAGQAPKLTDLSWCVNPVLPDMDIKSAPFIRNIKYLCVGSKSESSPLTPSRILLLLVESPSIQKLWIDTMTDPSGEPEPDLPSPIQLPQLLYLEIFDGSYVQISKLLRNAALSRLVGWSIHCEDFPIKSLPNVNPRSIIPLSSGKWRDCRSLELLIHPYAVEIKADADNIELISGDDGDIELWLQRILTYSWNGSVSIADCFEFICSVVDGGFWSSTKELMVTVEIHAENASLDEELDRDDWIRLLKTLPNLQKITVRCVEEFDYMYPEDIIQESHLGVINALAYILKDKDGNGHLICPDLTELYLYGMDLENGTMDLVDCLGRRATHGKRLGCLSLDVPSGMTDEVMRSLIDCGIAEKIEVSGELDSDSEE